MADTPLHSDTFIYANGALAGKGPWILRRGGLFENMYVVSSTVQAKGQSNTLNLANQQDSYLEVDVRFADVTNNAVATLYIRDNDNADVALWETLTVTFYANPTSGNSVGIAKRINGVSTTIATLAYNHPDRPVWAAGVDKRVRIQAVGTAVAVTWGTSYTMTATLASGDLRSGKASLYGSLAATNFPTFDNLVYGLIGAAGHPFFFSRFVRSRAA